MPRFQEREVGGWRVRIDRHLCVGFGDCVDVAPGALELDDEGIAVFRSEGGTMDPALLLEACRSCPVDAISVHDRDGGQIAP